MDAKQIREQIASKEQAERTAKEEIAALKAQLILTDNGYKVGDVLKSTLSEHETFRITGATDQGLVGVKSTAKQVVKPEDLKHYRLQGK